MLESNVVKMYFWCFKEMIFIIINNFQGPDTSEHLNYFIFRLPIEFKKKVDWQPDQIVSKLWTFCNLYSSSSVGQGGGYLGLSPMLGMVQAHTVFAPKAARSPIMTRYNFIVTWREKCKRKAESWVKHNFSYCVFNFEALKKVVSRDRFSRM